MGRRGRYLFLGSVLTLVFSILPDMSAWADVPEKKGPSELILLIQVVVLILLGRLLGEAMQRIGQPTVIGQLLAGILLGPSVLGAVSPAAQHFLFPDDAAQKAMISGVAELGVLMLLVLAGMETDLKLVRKVGKAAISVSVAGICLPFACGFALGEFLPESLLPDPQQRLMGSLLLGTALSISSVKIVAMVVREMDFMRRNVGQIILASAVIDDTIGWIIIAVIFSLGSQGTLDTASLARSVLGTFAFLAVSLTIGRRLVYHLIRWTNDNFVSELPVISLILVLMGIMAMITQAIGVHTVLGAFVAGILIGESPIMTRQIDEQLRGLITALFAPVFFGLAGVSADLTVLRQPDLLGLTAALIAIATIGKFAGAFVGGAIGGLRRGESMALACGMNARGSTEVIVATIGLSMGLLSQNLFTMIVAMAIITTMAMPPMLRWALARLPFDAEEKERLEREAADEKGFLPKIERLLLASDHSTAGRFASRLTGIIAGSRGIPTTIIHLDEQATEPAITAQKGDTPKEALQAEAEKAADKAEGEEPHEIRPDKVDVKTARKSDRPAHDAIAEEVSKGYGLLVLGFDDMVAPDGSFREKASEIAAGYEEPLAVVVARGDHLERPGTSGFKVLLPVSGAAISIRAAELAIAIARANNAPLTALFVKHTTQPTGTKSAGGKNRDKKVPNTHRNRISLSQEEAFLKEVVLLAERYGTKMRTAIHADIMPEEAILREARQGGYNLIVMGVSRRPGETLFFGTVPAAVLEKSTVSLLFLAS